MSLRSLYRPDGQARDILMINHWQQQTDESIADEVSRAIDSTLTDMALNGYVETPEKSKVAWDLQRISRRHQLPAQEGLHGFPPLKVTCSLPAVLGVSPRPLARRSKVLPELPVEQARREGDERVLRKVQQAPRAPKVPERYDSTGSQLSITCQLNDADRHSASRVADTAHDGRYDAGNQLIDLCRCIRAAYHDSNDHQNHHHIMDYADHHGLADLEHQYQYQHYFKL
nr:hypothetical protein B0A51_01487 [Rachicladosporium sp. CCFEE 5018]